MNDKQELIKYLQEVSDEEWAKNLTEDAIEYDSEWHYYIVTINDDGVEEKFAYWHSDFRCLGAL